MRWSIEWRGRARSQKISTRHWQAGDRMALEKALQRFTTSLLRFYDRVGELRLTAVVDRPEKNDAVVVDTIEYAVEDMIGWLGEAVQEARAAEKAAGHPPDLDQARRAIANCQERFRR